VMIIHVGRFRSRSSRGAAASPSGWSTASGSPVSGPLADDSLVSDRRNPLPFHSSILTALETPGAVDSL
jgi:hypothetical protein